MKKRYLLLCMVILTCLLMGCHKADSKKSTEDTGKTTTVAAKDSTKATTANTTATKKESTPDATTAAKGASKNTEASDDSEFTWSLYVHSDFYENIYGKEFMERVNDVITTIAAHEDTFAYEEDEDWGELVTIARYLFPPLDSITEEFDLDDDKATIHYAMTKDEEDAFLDDFKIKVEWWINGNVTLDGPDTLKALELYHFMSPNVTYDYDATNDDDASIDVSPCRAIMDQEGICQSFAGAYAYLLLQLGIDACPTGGLSEDDSSHEWTLLKLNDKWYYADVTFENGIGGTGLEYFGMNDEKRAMEGDFPSEYYNVGECNQIMGEDFPVDNSDLSELWNIVDASYFDYIDGVVSVTGFLDSGDVVTIELP